MPFTPDHHNRLSPSHINKVDHCTRLLRQRTEPSYTFTSLDIYYRNTGFKRGREFPKIVLTITNGITEPGYWGKGWFVAST